MAELKIVIAEDNPLMMELLSSILEEEDGFVVVGKADNGEDAYQMIMEKGPDLVLLDVIMPKLDGISVLEKVRAARSGKNMPAVIIVSAAGNETVASAAFRNGASYYILKPFDREILLDKIHLVAEERIRTKTVSVVREKPAETYFAKGDYIRQNLEDDVTQLLHEIGIPANIKGGRKGNAGVGYQGTVSYHCQEAWHHLKPCGTSHPPCDRGGVEPRTAGDDS